MWAIAFATRLRRACARRSGSAFSTPVWDGAQLEAAVGEKAHPVPQLVHEHAELDRLDAQELALLALGQQQQVIHQPGDPRDLRLHQPGDALHLLLIRVVLAREHLHLAADHGQRGAELVRGVGDERALSLEGVGEPVEHVVEGVRQHLHLLALTRLVVHARIQVPAVHARGDGGDPAQGP